MSMRIPGDQQQIASQARRERRFEPTAIPGIDRAIVDDHAHAIAMQAPSQYWRVNGFTALAPSVESTELIIRWKSAGEVIGVQFSTDTGDARSFCALGVKITSGPENASQTMNGERGTPDFIRFAGIVGIQPLLVAPLYRPVCYDDTWTFIVKNFDAANTYTPEITLHFRQCK